MRTLRVENDTGIARDKKGIFNSQPLAWTLMSSQLYAVNKQRFLAGDLVWEIVNCTTKLRCLTALSHEITVCARLDATMQFQINYEKI